MSYRRFSALFTAIFLVGAMALTAQSVPQAFSYQGVARDGSGAVLANTNLTVQMSIVDGGSNTALYVETHQASTNEFGLFTLSVGNGTAVTGTFGAIDWTAGTRELAVSIDVGSGLVDLGGSQLLSVPYAIASGSSINGGASALNELDDVAAGNPQAGDVLIYNGTSWVPGAATADLTLPYGDTVESDQLTPLLRIRQTGGGAVMLLDHVDPISVEPALEILTSSQEVGLEVTTTSEVEGAGRFTASNPRNYAPTLQVSTNGVGNAGAFFLNNTSSDSAALTAVTLGTGPGVFGQSTANGVAFGLYGSAMGECIIDQTGVRRFCPAGVFGEARRGPGVYGHNRDLGPGVQAYSENGKLFLGLGPSDVNAFPDTEFWVDNEGATYSRGGLRTPGTYHSSLPAHASRIATGDTGLAAGDLISVTPGGSFVQSRGLNDSSVVGVAVSSAALLTNVVLNDDGEPTNLTSKVSLAVSGIVTINVEAAAGPIVPGDLLAASITPGVATKAPADPGAGTVIAKAITGFSGAGVGTVQAVIMLR